MLSNKRSGWTLVVLALVGGLCGCGAQNGTGDKPFGGWPNPPGPWMASINVTMRIPERPRDATGPAQSYAVSMTYDNRAPVEICRYLEGAGYQETRFGIYEVRPGEHLVTVWMTRVGDPTVLARKLDTFAVSDHGEFAPSNWAVVNL